MARAGLTGSVGSARVCIVVSFRGRRLRQRRGSHLGGCPSPYNVPVRPLLHRVYLYNINRSIAYFPIPVPISKERVRVSRLPEQRCAPRRRKSAIRQSVTRIGTLTPRSILPVPDIAQARKKEGHHLTHKERLPSCIRGTIPTHVADTFVAMAAAGGLRTGDIQENLAQTTSRTVHLSPVIRLHASISDP
jgi:hypothetical protein